MRVFQGLPSPDGQPSAEVVGWNVGEYFGRQSQCHLQDVRPIVVLGGGDAQQALSQELGLELRPRKLLKLVGLHPERVRPELAMMLHFSHVSNDSGR
jgi:hypothetical protein